MNRRTLILSTTIAAVAVFAGGAAVYRRSRPEPERLPAVANDTLVRMHSPILGPVAAPVTIVEFFDPSCEACRAFYPLVKQIMGEANGQVRLALRYAAFHDGSDQAVRILEAARKQNRFEQVLEEMLAKQAEWADHGAPDIEKAWQIAAGAGLDLPQARRDAIAPAVNNVLVQDAADVKANGVDKTPTFFVNGKPLQDFSPTGLQDLVRSELDASNTGA